MKTSTVIVRSPTSLVAFSKRSVIFTASSGHTSAQRPQYVQRASDQVNMARGPSSSTVIRPGVQTLTHPPHPMHREASTCGRPRKPGGASTGTYGYFSVTRPAERQISASSIFPRSSFIPNTAGSFLLEAEGREAHPEEGDADQPGKEAQRLVDPETRVGCVHQDHEQAQDQDRREVDDEVHERADDAPANQVRPADEEPEEERAEDQLLHVEGPLEQGQRRPAVLDERAFHDLLLGLGNVERELAEQGM